MTRIWLRENKLQGLFRRERMRVYKTVTISKLLFKKKKKEVQRIERIDDDELFLINL